MMRRPLGAFLFYSAVTFLMLWPLTSRIGAVFPNDAGDPVLNTWLLWWSSHHLPLSSGWWNAAMFHPVPNAMALSEVLLGLLPITAPVEWATRSPLVAYNLAFLLSFPLCGLAAFALARELTGRDSAAFVAGAAFAFAPYRSAQLGHVQMLSYYWAPLALLGLHLFLRTGKRRSLLLFAVAWLMQALSNGYAMFHLSVVLVLWVAWFVRSRRQLLMIAGAWCVAALPMVPVLLNYWRVHRSWHLVRDINEIRRFGVDVSDLISAPGSLLIWGGRLGAERPETAAFPGITVIAIGVISAVVFWRWRTPSTQARTADQRVLIWISAIAAGVAMSAVVFGPWRIGPLSVSDFHKPFTIAVFARVAAMLRGQWLRQAWQARSLWTFYLLAMIAAYVLALGPEPRLLGRPMLYEPPYAWLMRLPGFDTLRVPARFVMLAVLCQAMLLAAAADRMSRWIEARSISASRNWRPLLATAVVVIGVLCDGAIRLRVVDAPRLLPALPSDIEAVAEMPVGDPSTDFNALYHATFHGLPIVNGYSGYVPAHYLPLSFALRDGHARALGEVASNGRLGVLVDQTRPDAVATADGLLAAGAQERTALDGTWRLFVMPPRSPRQTALAFGVPIASVTASVHPEDAQRMLDGTVASAWGTEFGQRGGETVTLSIGAPHRVGVVTLRMGAYAFGFPRELGIETSMDGSSWQQVWRGAPDVLIVAGAVADPASAPLSIDFVPVETRFVRLVQYGAEAGIPWWIAEVSLYDPGTTKS